MRGKRIVVGGIIALLCALIPLTAKATDMLTVSLDGEMVRMYREAYLVGAVAAEMPAIYDIEALKAQAVAARTRVVFGGCRTHPGADVCGDSTCCQGYLDDQEQKARWGEDCAKYRAKIEQAVDETRGLILTYDGKPIEVLYHAVSGGWTENSELVYANALPYLRGVPSPGEESVPGFETVVTVSQTELCRLFPDEAKNGMVALEVLERSASGRVLTIRVGAHTMTGRMFRQALGLRSTQFDLAYDGDIVAITQRGYGHGVGMSQAGANAMAENGMGFEEILLHYYTGVELERLVE